MSAFLYSHNFNFAFFWSHFIKNIYSLKKKKDIAHKRSEIQAEKCTDSWFEWHKILSVKETDSIILWFISDIKGYFCGAEIFQLFLSTGKWEGRGSRADTQKATLFPSGSALHPTMNGVLKNITLGTRLFFIPHNWAICPGVSSGLLGTVCKWDRRGSRVLRSLCWC